LQVLRRREVGADVPFFLKPREERERGPVRRYVIAVLDRISLQKFGRQHGIAEEGGVRCEDGNLVDGMSRRGKDLQI